MIKKNDKCWNISLKDCPHCDTNFAVTIVSNEDEKDCLLKVFKFIEYHREGCSPKEKKKLMEIVIKTIEKQEISTVNSYASSKIII